MTQVRARLLMRPQLGLVAASVFLALALAPSVSAQTLDELKGKSAFNWFSEPGKQSCVTVEGKLLEAFKSASYRCDLTPKTNTSAGVPVRSCTKTDESAEYLIFDSARDCDEERMTQDSNSEEE